MREIAAVALAVTATAFKARVHIAPGEAADDPLIEGLLGSAQAVVEAATRRIMSARDVEFQCRPYGWARWFLPVCPVMDLVEASWQDSTGAWTVLDISEVVLEMPEDEPQLVFPTGWLDALSETSILKIRVAAGNGALGPQRQQIEAVCLIAKSWYEAHMSVADVEAATETELSFGEKALIKQIRYQRPAEFADC